MHAARTATRISCRNLAAKEPDAKQHPDSRPTYAAPGVLQASAISQHLV